MTKPQKILFTEFAELKQGDGLGPKYETGKAYWLNDDQATRWKAEGIAEDAPESMKTENDPPIIAYRPTDLRIVRHGRNHFDVLGPDGEALNDAPLAADAAERLRQSLIGTPVPVRSSEPPKKITFEQRTDADGNRMIYAKEPWPAVMLIDADFAKQAAPAFVTVDGKKVTFIVANGEATYVRVKSAMNAFHEEWLCDLVPGSSYAPPPLPPAPPPAARAAPKAADRPAPVIPAAAPAPKPAHKPEPNPDPPKPAPPAGSAPSKE